MRWDTGHAMGARWFACIAALGLVLGTAPMFGGEKAVLVLGDSLSAEYDGTPHGGYYGVSDHLARNWVEILAVLRETPVDPSMQFGSYRELPALWDDVRLHGHKHNWAFYGWKTSDIVGFIESDDWYDQLLLAELDTQLQEDVGRVVIFAGGNDVNGRYGDLYGRTTLPAGFLDEIVGNLTAVIDYVRAVNPTLDIVVVNIPDVGVTPEVREDPAYPDPAGRAQASALIAEINRAIAGLEADPPGGRAVAVADVAALTDRLARGEPVYLGAIRLVDAADPENDPRHLFTNDGFHPNTCAQMFIARAIVDAFNRVYVAGISPVTDGEALVHLGLDPDLPYLEWIAAYPVAAQGMEDDPEEDGIVNLAEYALGLDPSRADPGWAVWAGASWRGGMPVLEMMYRPHTDRVRHVRLTPLVSDDLITWWELPASQMADNGDGSLSAWMAMDSGQHVFLRLRVTRLGPDQAG